MTGQLHVVYREERTSDGETSWYSYSFPDGVYTAGSSLEDVRDQFRRALALLNDDVDRPVLLEHVERPAGPGVFIRVAVDRGTLDREHVASLMRTGFAQGEQRPDVGSFHAATGDAVVVCCVATDPLSWVFGQMGEEDALHVAMAVTALEVRRSVIAGPAAGQHDEDSETLADLGFGATSTVAEFLATVTTGRGGHTRPVVLV